MNSTHHMHTINFPFSLTRHEYVCTHFFSLALSSYVVVGPAYHFRWLKSFYWSFSVNVSQTHSYYITIHINILNLHILGFILVFVPLYFYFGHRKIMTTKIAIQFMVKNGWPRAILSLYYLLGRLLPSASALLEFPSADGGPPNLFYK